jgi:hypothetical protein
MVLFEGGLGLVRYITNPRTKGKGCFEISIIDSLREEIK